MSSSAEAYASMAPPDLDPRQWHGWPSLAWQNFATAALAMAAYLTAAACLPSATRRIEGLISNIAQETSQAAVLLIGGGRITGITPGADGSLAVAGAAVSDLHQVFVSAAGPLGAVLLGAATLHAALTRRGLHLMLLLWSGLALALAHTLPGETAVRIALYFIGLSGLVVAYIPLHAQWKAPILLLLGLVLLRSTALGVGALFQPLQAGDPAAPALTDAQMIAILLETSTGQVGGVLLAISIAAYAIAAGLIAQFHHRNFI